MLPERIFQRRIGDSSSVVGDRRGCHYGDDLQDLLLGEPGGHKRIELLRAYMPTFLNERLSQGGQSGKSLVLGRPPLANGAGLLGTDSLLRCQRLVWKATA